MRRLALPLTLLLATGAAAAGTPLPAPYQAALRDLRMSPDPVERARAAVALGQGFTSAPAPGADRRIIDALAESARLDPDPTVQAMAAYALCVLQQAAGVPPLVAALRRHADVGGDAEGYFDRRLPVPVGYMYRVLGVVGGRAARDFLLSMATDGERGTRVLAISTLGTNWLQDGEVDARLRGFLEERDPAIRGAATWVLDERQRERGARAR